MNHSAAMPMVRTAIAGTTAACTLTGASAAELGAVAGERGLALAAEPLGPHAGVLVVARIANA